MEKEDIVVLIVSIESRLSALEALPGKLDKLEELPGLVQEQVEVFKALKDAIVVGNQISAAYLEASKVSVPLPVVQGLLKSLLAIILIIFGGVTGIKYLSTIGQ